MQSDMFSTKTLQYVLIRSKGQSLLDLQGLMHANTRKFLSSRISMKIMSGPLEDGGIIYFIDFLFLL